MSYELNILDAHVEVVTPEIIDKIHNPAASWGCQGIILVNSLEKSEPIIVSHYISLLRSELQEKYQRLRNEEVVFH